MNNKNLGDVCISSVMLGLCGYFWAVSSSYKDEVRVFPQLFLAILAITSFLILARAAMRLISDNKEKKAAKLAGAYEASPYDDEGTDLKPLKKALLPYTGLLMLLAYVLGINYIGFFVSTAVFLIGFMRFLQLKNWLVIILVTAGVEVFAYLLFVVAFMIRMPSGLLF